jgi:serine/threonine protein kinase
MTSVTVSSGERWELGEVVGSGGAGRVHVATCGAYEPHVIKLVPKVDGAFRELLVADDLRGVPNVIPVIDTGQTDTHWALLMPRAMGSLRDRIDEATEPVPEHEALPILVDMARALAALSDFQADDVSKSVVHRDLKPENVLYLNGAWCLSDFGIARYANKATAKDTRRYFMTADYAAPEQWRGLTATSATDVYAFGIIAFELLMKRRPFNGDDLRDQHLYAAIPKIKGVSPHLATILLECLYKGPGARPAAIDLVRRLEYRTTERPVANSINVLRQANFEKIASKTAVPDKSQARREMLEERGAVWSIALRRIKQISEILLQTIVDNAPECTLTGTIASGWSIQLGRGVIGFGSNGSQVKASLRRRLPFDVIGICGISVQCLPEKRDSSQSGRSHSLWFCDAKVEGSYSWFETAFSNVVKPMEGNIVVNMAKPQASYAGDPSSPDVMSALGPSEREPEHARCQVVWPFTPLIVDDLDDFMERWVTWFAQAAQGDQSYLTARSTVPVRGSWRIDESYRESAFVERSTQVQAHDPMAGYAPRKTARRLPPAPGSGRNRKSY